MTKTRVFISSGQRHSSGDEISEREIVQEVRKMLENQFNFQVYVATEQHSIDAFTKNILENLEKSEYFLFIDFMREKIESKESREILYRGSLFSHQELAIAVYLEKPLLVFHEFGVEDRNGKMIRYIIQNFQFKILSGTVVEYDYCHEFIMGE